MSDLIRNVAALASLGMAACLAAQDVVRTDNAPIGGPRIVQSNPKDMVIVDKDAIRRQQKGPVVIDLTSSSPATQALFAAMGRVRVLEAKVAAAEELLTITRSQVRAGMLATSEVPPLEVKVMELQAELFTAQADLVRARRRSALEHKVTFRFKNVLIRDVARVLSKVSPAGISVDSNVPTDVTVTSSGRDVPLGTALELIADSVALNIDAGENSGLKLVLPTRLTIDGTTVVPQGPTWPWKEDAFGGSHEGAPLGLLGSRWRVIALDRMEPRRPGYGAAESRAAKTSEGFGGSPNVESPVQHSGAAQLDSTQVRVQQNVVTGGPPSVPVVTGPVPIGAESITVTPLGSDRLVLTEPAMGPQGEPGFMLTLYKVVGGRLVKCGAVFHRAAARRERPMSRMGGRPADPPSTRPARAPRAAPEGPPFPRQVNQPRVTTQGPGSGPPMGQDQAKARVPIGFNVGDSTADTGRTSVGLQPDTPSVRVGSMLFVKWVAGPMKTEEAVKRAAAIGNNILLQVLEPGTWPNGRLKITYYWVFGGKLISTDSLDARVPARYIVPPPPRPDGSIEFYHLPPPEPEHPVNLKPGVEIPEDATASFDVEAGSSVDADSQSRQEVDAAARRVAELEPKVIAAESELKEVQMKVAFGSEPETALTPFEAKLRELRNGLLCAKMDLLEARDAVTRRTGKLDLEAATIDDSFAGEIAPKGTKLGASERWPRRMVAVVSGPLSADGAFEAATALGRNVLLVVSEKGKGPKGESGLWVTTHWVLNGRLWRPSARAFVGKE